MPLSFSFPAYKIETMIKLGQYLRFSEVNEIIHANILVQNLTYGMSSITTGYSWHYNYEYYYLNKKT